jgi:hypothetical protein
VLDGRGSQLSVFEGGRATGSESWLTDSKGERHRYEIFRVRRELRAEEVGQTLIGPVFLRANYPTAVGRGFFGRSEITRSRKETARADAVVVEVKAPPPEGRPPEFTGAIGQYTMAVTAKPTRIEQGQPVTLIISIEGSPLEGVAGPDLASQPELASRFDFSRDELVGDLERGAKVFRAAIFPKQEGGQTIPPISWAFFNPRDERYETLISKPVGITVDPPSAASIAITLADDAELRSNGTGLTLAAGGLSPNYIAPDAVLASQSFRMTAPWAAAVVVPPILYVLVTLTTAHRARLRADVGFARRRRAGRRARRLIKRAMAQGEPARQVHGLAEAMIGYLSDRFDLPPGELTPEEVRGLLTEHGAEPSLASDIAGFVENRDAVRYAPSAAGDLSPVDAGARVIQWIKRIERTTR